VHRVSGLFIVAACVVLAACGKTRAVRDDGEHWDDASEANGFHATSDGACESACVADGPRGMQAMRSSPETRVVTPLDDASPALVFAEPGCLATAGRTEPMSGAIACVNPDDGRVATRARLGIPSALAMSDVLYAADRDLEGHSRVFADAKMIADGEKVVRTLVTHRGDAFWIDANARIRRARGHGAVVETIAHAPRVDARFLAVDDSAAYDVHGSELVRIALRGGERRLLGAASSPIRDVVLSGEWLYWTELGDARLACQPDGSKPSCHARGRTILHPHGSLHRVRVVAPFDHRVLASGLDDADGILVAHQVAYVSTRRGLVRVALASGSSSPTVLATPQPALGRPVLDTTSWTLFVQMRDRRTARAAIVAVIP
jgi:hypothetical protein